MLMQQICETSHKLLILFVLNGQQYVLVTMFIVFPTQAIELEPDNTFYKKSLGEIQEALGQTRGPLPNTGPGLTFCLFIEQE